MVIVMGPRIKKHITEEAQKPAVLRLGFVKYNMHCRNRTAILNFEDMAMQDSECSLQAPVTLLNSLSSVVLQHVCKSGLRIPERPMCQTLPGGGFCSSRLELPWPRDAQRVFASNFAR